MPGTHQTRLACARTRAIAEARDADERVSLQQPVRKAGYSMEHLARLAQEGSVPDVRPIGSKVRLVLRNGDVPPWATPRYIGDAETRDLASGLFEGKEGQ